MLTSFFPKRCGDFLRLVQRRIANISVSSTSIRRRPKGTVEAIREILMGLDLSKLSSTSEKQFKNWLEKVTRVIVRKTGVDWGGARKSINLFLMESLYNRFMEKEYNVREIEDFLELPLDKPNMQKLRRESRKRGKRLSRCDNIKDLTQEKNEEYQSFARELAIEEAVPRVYLDLKYWREE